MEHIFRFLLYGFLAWALYSMYLIYEFHHLEEYAHIKKYSVQDLKITIIPCLFFFVYKRICLKLFFGYMKSTLDPTKFPTEEELDIRATKNSIWLSCIIYYAFTTILSYYLFNESFFWPGLLGGSGQCNDIYKFTPFAADVPYITLFYQMQFGWHFHTLIDHVVYKWHEPKFWEMFLHHCVAVFLIFFSYLSNQLPVGILVLTTHDPCDIGLYGSRLYNDRIGKKTPIFALIYAYFMGTWSYLRLFVFPKCIVGAGVFNFNVLPLDPRMTNIYLYLIVMMTALVLLHLYWFIFIVRIFINAVFTSSDCNVYDKSRKSQ